jgi:tryptophanyl-tRNA synthetase
MSLRDGNKKMSKSDPSDYSRIMLSDDAEGIVQKIRKAKTDPLPLPLNIKEAQTRPEALNLLTIFAALSDSSTIKIINDYAGKEFSSFKKDLADLSVEKITPISSEMRRLMEDREYLDSIMRVGKEKAIAVAEPVLSQVYEIVGFAKT